MSVIDHVPQGLLRGQFQHPSPLSSASMGHDAISEVVMGGTLLPRGRGYAVDLRLGVPVPQIVETLVFFDGTNSSYRIRIITGCLLLAFVVVQSFATRGQL